MPSHIEDWTDRPYIPTSAEQRIERERTLWRQRLDDETALANRLLWLVPLSLLLGLLFGFILGAGAFQ